MSAPEYKPHFLQDAEVHALRVKQPEIDYIDAFSRQLRELYQIQVPGHIGENKDVMFASEEYATYVKKMEADYVHVHLPWNHSITKSVNAREYFLLKTNRNQDLITAEEQVKLYAAKVGVFGLSVGSNIAFALTQSGISRSIVIADFDELDTTNLNRISAGIHQIGLNKSVIVARRIYEDNPFADVRALTRGIDVASLGAMLDDASLDIIVDEVDDMPFKIEARKLALKYKVPVVMATDNGDGIVLHVERYDLGYDKIFGKPVSHFDSIGSNLSGEQAGRIIMEDIVGGVNHVDSAMLASVKRVLGKELVSWSQLGTAALLGGVVATFIVKQILLGKSTNPDIRAYISPLSGEWASHN